jgi:hypothetical protein
MKHFHVYHAMPGCLPDGDVICIDDPQAALDAWRADFRDTLDDITDDGVFLEIDTRQNLVTVFDVENNGGHSLDLGNGYRYAVERVPFDRTSCDWADVSV